MLHVIAIPHRRSPEHWRLTESEYDNAYAAYNRGDSENDLGFHDLSTFRVIESMGDLLTERRAVRYDKPHQWVAILSVLDEIEIELA